MIRTAVMLFAVCIAVLLAGAAWAGGMQIYKWVDNQGVVHYSDKAPTQAPQAVSLVELPEFPPPDPEAEAAEQAYVAFANQWYQNVLKQQSQLRHEQFLAWKDSQPAEPPAPPAEQVSYVTPCWLCAGFGFRHHHEPDADDFMKPLHPVSKPFQSNIWSTQPNLFTQSLYQP